MHSKYSLALVALALLVALPETAYSQGQGYETRLFKTEDLQLSERIPQIERLVMGGQPIYGESTQDGFVALEGISSQDSSNPWLYEGELAAVVRKFIEPISWLDQRSDLKRVKGGLLATNTTVVLNKLQAFLEDIREGRSARVRVLTKIVEVKRQQGSPPSFAPVTGTFLDSAQQEALKAALKARKAVLLNGKEVTMADGEFRVVKQLKAHSYLAHFPIYQGGTVPVNEHENASVYEGMQVQLRVSIPRDRREAAFDCVVERCVKTGMRDRVFDKVGTLQLPETKLLRAASSFRAPASKQAQTMVLASFFSKNRRSQFVVLVQVTTLFKKRAQDPMKEHMALPIQYYRGPANFQFSLPWKSSPDGPDESSGGSFSFGESETVEDPLSAGLKASSLFGSNARLWNRCLLSRGPKWARKAARDWLAVQQPSSKRFAYQLVEVELANAAIPKDREVKPETVKYWLTNFLRHEMSTAAYLRQKVALSQHSETRILNDVELSSGGTGKEMRTVAAPSLASIGRGRLFMVQGLSETKTGLRLKVQLQTSDYDELKIQKMQGYNVDCPQNWRKVKKEGIHRLADGHGVILTVKRGETKSRATMLILRSLN